MDTEVREPRKILDIDSRVKKLESALGDVNVLKETLTDCDTSELIAAFNERHGRPIICAAIEFWHDFRHPRVDVPCVAVMQEILEVLVWAGADINEPYNYRNLYYETPIARAIKYRNLGLLKLLLDFGADPTYSLIERYVGYIPTFYKSPLRVAAEKDPAYVTLLLERGAVPTADNDSVSLRHNSPLDAACCRDKPDVLDILMDFNDKTNRPFPWKSVTELKLENWREDNVLAILQREYHLWNDQYSRLQHMIFKSAVKKRCTKVMSLLIQQNTHIVHTPWMLEISLADELDSDKHKNFLSWFVNLQSQVLPLQLICRNQILRQLGPRAGKLIVQLELPQILKDYLKMKYPLSVHHPCPIE